MSEDEDMRRCHACGVPEDEETLYRAGLYEDMPMDAMHGAPEVLWCYMCAFKGPSHLDGEEWTQYPMPQLRTPGTMECAVPLSDV